ncbi:MAG: putative body protein [Chlorobi bacterium]|nr:putative body protein [Chlorobiota bacterium]
MPDNAALPDGITESIAIGNVGSIANQPAMLSNLMYANLVQNTNLSQQNAVANQQAMNQLGISIVGKTVNLISNLSPMEAVAVQKLDTGNDVAEEIAALKAADASGATAQSPSTT